MQKIKIQYPPNTIIVSNNILHQKNVDNTGMHYVRSNALTGSSRCRQGSELHTKIQMALN